MTLRVVRIAGVLGCLLLAQPVWSQSLSDEPSASGANFLTSCCSRS